MNTKNWTKKDKVACIIIFVISILTFVVFLSTMTLSYFYDEHSASDFVTAGTVSIKVTGGSDGNGSIEFPSVLTPNTFYKTSEYNKLIYKVTNTSTSGDIYLMIKLESDYINLIRPSIDRNYWVVGGDNAEYLYYIKPIARNTTVDLCTSWQVGNFTNATVMDGTAVTYKITAYAVQAQGGALEALIAGNVDGWQYAPQIFRDIIANS